MSFPKPHRRKPLLNLMRVISISMGIVSRRTIEVLLSIARSEPRDRTVDAWVKLMLAIEAVDGGEPEESERAYRRRCDPDGAPDERPRRKRSGVQPKFILGADDEPIEKSG